MAKIQPAVSTILINVPASSSGYVDLSQCASIVNRRFYRQGLNWAVAGFRGNNAAVSGGGRISIEKLPETWVMSNAWHKIFAHWRKQQQEALDDSGQESVRAAFNDFKIYMDTAHVAAGDTGTFSANLLPVKSGGGSFLVGSDSSTLTAEWQPSQVVIPNAAADASGSDVDAAEFYLHMVGSGSTATSKGIIEGYSNSRALPISPDPQLRPNTNNQEYNWLRAMFDVGNDDQEVLQNVSERNNEVPYPHEAYPGGGIMASVLQLHAHTDISATINAVDNSFFMPGTQVPCGLLKIKNDTNKTLEMFIDLVPGHHRGYLCEPMQEF